MYYNQYFKPVSSDLATKLYMDHKYKISPYVKFIQTHGQQYSFYGRSIASPFSGLPCDNLRLLFRIITFNEVFVLLHQGKDYDAFIKAKRMQDFDKIYWDNHELDLISMGHLLK